MSNIDEIFRDGLGDRKPEIPRDMWNKIMANKASVPEGEALDRLFSNNLRDRRAEVPAAMWGRIVGARRPVAYRSYAVVFLLLLLFSLAGVVAWQAHLPGTQVQNGAGSAPKTAPHSLLPESEARSAPQAIAPSVLEAPAGALNASEVTKPPPIDQRAGPYERFETVTSAITTLPINPLPVAETLPNIGPVALAETGSFRKVKKPLFGEVLFGAAYAHQSLTPRGDGAQPLREAREVSEFPEVSFQFTARVNYRLRGRWGLLAGLTYAEIRNQLEYERPTLNGPELVRSNNRFRMAELPLLLTYELPGKKLQLSVNAGPVINLSTGISGRFIDPDFAAPRDLAESGAYRNSAGIGWTASLTTTYSVGNSGTTELLLEPFFKAYPGAFTRPDAQLSEKYWLAGLQLGLRKKL